MRRRQRGECGLLGPAATAAGAGPPAPPAPPPRRRWTVRRVADVEAGDGRLAVTLEVGDGTGDGAEAIGLDLPLPALLGLAHELARVAHERWPELPLRDPLLEPEPLAYRADAVRLRAVAGPEPALFLHLRSAHAAPLRVRLGPGLARPLLARLERAAGWLEDAAAAAAAAAEGRAPPGGDDPPPA